MVRSFVWTGVISRIVGESVPTSFVPVRLISIGRLKNVPDMWRVTGSRMREGGALSGGSIDGDGNGGRADDKKLWNILSND